MIGVSVWVSYWVTEWVNERASEEGRVGVNERASEEGRVGVDEQASEEGREGRKERGRDEVNEWMAECAKGSLGHLLAVSFPYPVWFTSPSKTRKVFMHWPGFRRRAAQNATGQRRAQVKVLPAGLWRNFDTYYFRRSTLSSWFVSWKSFLALLNRLPTPRFSRQGKAFSSVHITLAVIVSSIIKVLLLTLQRNYTRQNHWPIYIAGSRTCCRRTYCLLPGDI